MYFFVFFGNSEPGLCWRSLRCRKDWFFILFLCVFVLINVGGWLCWSQSFDLCVHFRVELRIFIGKCGFKVVDCFVCLDVLFVIKKIEQRDFSTRNFNSTKRE